MIFLQFFASSSVLIGLILLIRMVFRKKLAPGVVYALWLIPLLRLLIPFGMWELPVFGTVAEILNAPYSLVSELMKEESASQSFVSNMENEYIQVQMQESNIPAGTKVYEAVAPPIEAGTAETHSGTAASVTGNHIMLDFASYEVVLLFIWLAGSILLGSYVLYRNRQLKKSVASLEKIAEVNEIPVCVDDRVGVPCLVGVIHPRIIITRDTLENPQFYQCILQHEMAHYQQKDHIWTAVRVFMCVLYWWNPLVWQAAVCAEEDAELACDAKVLKGQSVEERKKYGYVLLQLLENAQVNRYQLYAATSMSGSMKSIKKRIQEISSGTVTKRYILLPVILLLFTLLALGCGTPTEKSWIQAGEWEHGEEQDIIFSEAECEYALQDDIRSILLYYEVYEYGELAAREVVMYGDLDENERNNKMKLRRESSKYENSHNLIIEFRKIGVTMEGPLDKYEGSGYFAGSALLSDKGKIEVNTGDRLILLADFRGKEGDLNQSFDCRLLSSYTEEQLHETLENNYAVSFIRLSLSDLPEEAHYQLFMQKENPAADVRTNSQLFATAWAEAFVGRDAETIVSLASENAYEQLETSGLMAEVEEEDYRYFGWSSPWPMMTDQLYEIVSCDSSGAEIIYYAADSTPHVQVWRETLEFEKVDGEFTVASENIKFYGEIFNIEEFLEAYPDGRVTDTMMDYHINGMGEALNQNALEDPESPYYAPLFDPATAAGEILNICDDRVRYHVEETEGLATVSIHFLKEGGAVSAVNVNMWQPYGEDGIWIPK